MAVEVTQNLTQVTISSVGVAGVNGTSGTSGTFGNVLSSSFYISGSIIPSVGDGEATSSFSLGSSTNAWKDLWISEGTIYFIGGNLQTQSISLNENNEIVLSSFNLNTASLITTASYNEFTSSFGDFTSSYLLISESIASRLDAATNEQDLSTYLSQSAFNEFTSSYEYYSSSISDRVVLLEYSASNNSGTGDGFPYEGIAQITGSLSVSGSLTLNGADISGTSGTSGTSGADGTFFGTSGVDGTSGSSGSSGTAGSSGTSGENGSSGTSATSGTAGSSGTSAEGSSGTSGVDGTSGTSFSGSLDLEYVNTFTGSIETRVVLLEDFSSSINLSAGSSGTSGTSFSGSIDLDSLNTFTSSIEIRVIALEDFTSSLSITGSGTSGTSGLSVSGSAGSDGTSGTSGTSFSGSLDLESINTFTSSIEIRVIALEDFTSSLSGSGIAGSSGTSGTAGTSAIVDTLLFATTGSNTFVGDQTISGSILISGSVVPSVAEGGYTSSYSLGSSTNAWKELWVSNGSVNFVDPLSGNTASISLNESNVISVQQIESIGNLNVTGSLGAKFLQLDGSWASGGDGDIQDGGMISFTPAHRIYNHNSNNLTIHSHNPINFYITKLYDENAKFNFTGSVKVWGDREIGPGVNNPSDTALEVIGNSAISGSIYVSGSNSTIVLPNHATAPSSPNSGSLYFNTTDSHFYGWDGVQWKQLDN